MLVILDWPFGLLALTFTSLCVLTVTFPSFLRIFPPLFEEDFSRPGEQAVFVHPPALEVLPPKA